MTTNFDRLTRRPAQWPGVGDSAAKLGLGAVAATVMVCTFLLTDPSRGSSPVSGSLLTYLAIAAIGPFVLLATPRVLPHRRPPDREPDPARMAYWAVLVAAGGTIVVGVALLPASGMDIQGSLAGKLAVATTFGAVILAQSGTEELLFRVLLPLLLVRVFGRSPHRNVCAVAVSVLLFSAWHLPATPLEFLTHIVFGLFMHQLLSVSQRISVAVLAHVANNVIASSLVVQSFLAEQAPGIPLLLYAALSLLVWRVLPRQGAWPADQWHGGVRRGAPAYGESTLRMTYVDAARGVALLVIMIENVFIYMPAESGLAFADSTSRGVRAVLALIVEYRGLPFFGILLGFGVGAMLSRGDGARVGRVIRRRGAALILIGAIHGMLVFSGDILAIFGLALWSLAWIARRPVRVTWALWLTGALFVMQTAVLPVTLFVLARTDPGGNIGSTLEPGFVGAFALRPQEWLIYFGTSPFLSSGILFPVLVGYATAPLLLGGAACAATITRLKIAVTVLGIGSIGACLPYAWSLLGSWGSAEVTAGGVIALILAQIGGLMGAVACWFAVIAVSARSASAENRPGPLVRLAAAAGKRSMSIYLAHSLVFLVVLAPSMLGVGSVAPLALLAPAVVLLWFALAGLAAKRPPSSTGYLETLVRDMSEPSEATGEASVAVDQVAGAGVLGAGVLGVADQGTQLMVGNRGDQEESDVRGPR